VLAASSENIRIAISNKSLNGRKNKMQPAALFDAAKNNNIEIGKF